MIFLLIWIGVAVFSFQGLFLHRFMRPESPAEWFFQVLFYCFINGFAAIFCLGAAVGISRAFDDHPVDREPVKLAVLRDRDGVDGRFFLGSGTISSVPYYFYYEQLSDGGLRPGKVEIGRGVIVYEKDREDAEMIVSDWIKDFPWWAFIVCLTVTETGDHSYIFNVPTGSVRKGFSL